MQDNLHEDLFSDHAWNEMRKVLDREMPERKRRGAFWLWFLPALGMCVLLGRDSLLQPKVAAKKTPVEKAAIAQLEAHTVKKAEQNSKNTPEDPTSVPVKPGLEEASSNAMAGLNAPVTLTGRSQASKKSGLTTTLVNESAPDIAFTLTVGDKKTPTTALQSENTSPLTADLFREESVTEVEQVEERWTSSQMITTGLMVLTPRDQEVPQVQLKPYRTRQKLEWWAEAGTQLASGTNNLSGYRTGILAGIPIGRLRLYTGPGYEQTEVGIQSVQRDVLTGKENYSDVKLATSGNGVGSSSAGRNTAESVSTIQLRFVNWQVGVQYPLTRHLGLKIGGNAHYLESVKLGGVFVKEPLLNNGATQMDIALSNGNNQFVPQQPNENLTSESFRNFGLSAQVGLSYRLATRWHINLDYRRSLQDFTKVDNLLLKPHWVDFGLRYRFK